MGRNNESIQKTREMAEKLIILSKKRKKGNAPKTKSSGTVQRILWV